MKLNTDRDYLSLAIIASSGFASGFVLARLVELALSLSINSLATGQNIAH